MIAAVVDAWKPEEARDKEWKRTEAKLLTVAALYLIPIAVGFRTPSGLNSPAFFLLLGLTAVTISKGIHVRDAVIEARRYEPPVMMIDFALLMVLIVMFACLTRVGNACDLSVLWNSATECPERGTQVPAEEVRISWRLFWGLGVALFGLLIPLWTRFVRSRMHLARNHLGRYMVGWGAGSLVCLFMLWVSLAESEQCVLWSYEGIKAVALAPWAFLLLEAKEDSLFRSLGEPEHMTEPSRVENGIPSSGKQSSPWVDYFRHRPLLIGAVAVGFVLVSWVAALYALPSIYGTPQGAGEFGDMFGAVNALFSGFAFIGVVVAILLQSQELELQRQELRDTRAELEGQKLQMQKQNDTLSLQVFETSFFQLVAFHKENAGRLEARPNGPGSTSYTGSAAFEQSAGVFESRLRNAVGDARSEAELLPAIDRIYKEVCLAPQSDFGHYFRNLYHIVKFVDQSTVEDKKRYTSLLRAQLSNSELSLLFYNCLSELGRHRFKKLVERYALLENMKESDLTGPHRKLYDPSAFGTKEGDNLS